MQPLGNEDICQEHHGHFSEGLMINRWKEWGTPCLYSKPRKTTSKLKSQWFTVLSRGSTRIVFWTLGVRVCQFHVLFPNRTPSHCILVILWTQHAGKANTAWTCVNTQKNPWQHWDAVEHPAEPLGTPEGTGAWGWRSESLFGGSQRSGAPDVQWAPVGWFFSGYTSQYMGGFSYIKN